MTFYLYDHHTNVKTPITYKELEELTGIPRTTLGSYKSRGNKIPKLNVYLIDDKTSLKQRRKWYSSVKYKGERWMPIKNHPDYQISNYGRVKKGDEFLLPSYPNGKGLAIRLQKDNKVHYYRIARLVYSHFVRELKSNEVIYYKNGLNTDCYVFNLKAITPTQNGQLHAWKSRAITVAKIDKKTKKVIQEYKTITLAAKENFMSVSAMFRRCHGFTEDENYIFEFVEEDEQYG